MRATWEFAHRLQDLGYSVLPLAPGRKTPILPGWQHARSTHSSIDEWWEMCPTANLGIHCGFSGLSVADCDSDQAAEWVASNLPESRMYQHSPRGGLHVFFSDPEGVHRPRVNVMDIRLDIRAGLSQIVSFPSRCEKGSWRLEGLTRPDRLPAMPHDWLKDAERARHHVKQLVGYPADSRTEWAREVLYREYVSFDRRGGDMGLFKAACFLVQRAKLSDAQALALLREWNQCPANVDVPWGDDRIEYKVSEARRLMK